MKKILCCLFLLFSLTACKKENFTDFSGCVYVLNSEEADDYLVMELYFPQNYSVKDVSLFSEYHALLPDGNEHLAIEDNDFPSQQRRCGNSAYSLSHYAIEEFGSYNQEELQDFISALKELDIEIVFEKNETSGTFKEATYIGKLDCLEIIDIE